MLHLKEWEGAIDVFFSFDLANPRAEPIQKLVIWKHIAHIVKSMTSVPLPYIWQDSTETMHKRYDKLNAYLEMLPDARWFVRKEKPQFNGILISQVKYGGITYEKGVKPGWILTHINGKTVHYAAVQNIGTLILRLPKNEEMSMVFTERKNGAKKTYIIQFPKPMVGLGMELYKTEELRLAVIKNLHYQPVDGTAFRDFIMDICRPPS